MSNSRSWSLVDLNLLKEHIKSGFDVDELPEILNRTKRAILNKINRLNLELNDISKEEDLINVCYKIIEQMYEGDSKTTACAKFHITRDKFDRCIKRNIELNKRYDDLINDTFKCYKCSKILSKNNLHYFEKSNKESYNYHICIDCHEDYVDDYSTTLNGRLSRLTRAAKQRDKNCDFNKDYLKQIYYEQDGKCKYSGLVMKYDKVEKFDFELMSIDRIDSSLGYIKGNIALCCYGINRMKSELSVNDFIKLCKIIVNNQTKDNPEIQYCDCGF